MAIHMSIRLAWHSDGWNGHICKRPCENSYCIGQHSYPGDLIASTRDLEFEAAHAGESCSALPCKAACGLSVNAFGKDTITVDILHAYNEIHSLPDQVCKGIKTFVITVCHKDGTNRVGVTIYHCVKCRAFLKFLFPLHKEIAVGLIGDII